MSKDKKQLSQYECSNCGESCEWIAYVGWRCKKKCVEKNIGAVAICVHCGYYATALCHIKGCPTHDVMGGKAPDD